MGDSLISAKFVAKCDFYGFNNNRKSKFIIMNFKSHLGMREFDSVLRNPIEIDGKSYTFEKYESNIEPLIRFMHIKNITSCGWLT